MARLIPYLATVIFLTQTNGLNLPDCPINGSEIVFKDQPQNSTVCLGTQARMNCTYRGTSTTPSWRINSMTYRSFGLPPHHIFNGRALIVDGVFLEDNGTTYQCFFDLFVNGTGLCVVQSTIGKLTVLETGSAACERAGPENITRMEGESYIFIPCTIPGFIPPIWEINGSIYDFYQLPYIYTPRYGGITIKLVERTLNGVSFRCYIRMGYTVEASSIGYLTVKPRGGPVKLDEVSSNIFVNHQSTIFNDNLTLSWKPVNHSQCNDYQVVSRASCGHNSTVVNMWSSSDSQNEVNISANAVIINGTGGSITRADFLIKMIDGAGFVCNQTKSTIQLQTSASAIKLNSSFAKTNDFNISTSNMTFNIVLPQSGSEQDCFCPIFFFQDKDCYDLRSCSCLSKTNFSSSFFNFCRLSEDQGISMLIRNLTKEVNGSRIWIVHNFFCENKFIPPYRIYSDLLEIAIVDVLPAPPTLSFNEENNTVCILPVDEEGNPPDSYSITVYDITAEEILDKSNISATHSIFCIEMHGYSRDCVPLSVHARAINRYGQMDTTISTPTLINSTNAPGKICTCLNETVQLTVQPIANNNEQSITLNVSCVQSKYVSDLKLKAVFHTKAEQDIECNNANQDTKLVYEHLECNIGYNMSIYWTARYNNRYHYCLFKHMVLTPPCNGNTPWTLLILLAIALAVAVLIFITVVSGYVCWRLRNQNKSELLRFSRSENQNSIELN